MIRRIAIAGIVAASIFAIDLPEVEAGRRRGLFGRNRVSQATRYRSNNYRQTRSSSQKLHLTHSRSAILDGFFGPFPGGRGHDRSYYVGK